MGTCVTKIRHDPGCGGGGLQVFMDEDGSYNGYCFSCETVVDNPFGDAEPPEFTPPDQEELAAQVHEVLSYPVCGIPDRKLKKSTLAHFGCRFEVSQSDGQTPTAVMFPYGKDGTLYGWKVRLLSEKRQWAVGTTKGAHLFGWKQAVQSGSKTLYITEGEFDAMALWQVLKDSNEGTAYADQGIAVVSLRHGAGDAVRAVNEYRQDIEAHFEDVVLVFDMDDAGNDAAERVCKIMPNWKRASLPEKDANDCLIKGASKALKSAVVFRATKPKNSRIVQANSLHEEARKPAEWGLSTPWPKLTDLTRGIRRAETWYWGAGVKMGKSELVNALAAHMIQEHKVPVYMAKPEEAVSKSYKMLAGKIVGKVFHDPKVEFDEAAYDRAGEAIRDLALFTDVYQMLSWDNLKQDIVYVNQEFGVEDVFIDPITCFTNHMSASETNDFLNAMTAEISALAKDFSFTAHLFCHLRAPDTGPPHERGGKVFSTQFAGGRAMMRSCNYMLGLEGDKDPDADLYDRNTRRLVLLEDREYGASGVVDLYWDHKTSLFNQIGGE